VSEVSKHFFFEKKKQKTFVSLGRGRELPAPLFSESSLLLFFKKPVLSSLALASVFSLTACSSSPPPAPIIYKPLDFSYLPPLTLRVASVNVQNTYVPGPDEATLIGEDPEAPANAISDLLNHRLIPSGAPGTANVTIETASLDESGGTLTGTMAVRVDVASADGRSTGYTEASISHREAAPDGNASQEDVRAALYDMTKTLTEDLNDRLQYQLEHDLSFWMVYGGSVGAAPVVSGASGGAPGGIVATPLPGPGTPAALTPATGATPPTTNLPAPGNALPPGSLPLGTLPLGSVPVPSTGNGVSQ